MHSSSVCFVSLVVVYCVVTCYCAVVTFVLLHVLRRACISRLRILHVRRLESSTIGKCSCKSLHQKIIMRHWCVYTCKCSVIYFMCLWWLTCGDSRAPPLAPPLQASVVASCKPLHTTHCCCTCTKSLCGIGKGAHMLMHKCTCET
jgi:hypothetical protein